MRSERGQATVEFALAAAVLLAVAIGSIEVARAAWQLNAVGYATREGARYAIAHGAASKDPVGPAPLSDAPIRDAVRRAAIGLPAPDVTVSWPDGDNAAGSRVTVETRVAFAPVADAMLRGAFRLTLRSATTQTIR
jgi:Flp pilus assembly protein TadG